MTAEDDPLKFIHATFPIIHEPGQRPTRSLVKYLQSIIYYNAISILSTYNNHDMGHMGLVTTNAEYESLNPNAATHMPLSNPWLL